MFELYSVPSLTYCIDGLMSFYQNNRPSPINNFTSNGLVISFNTASTSIIPVLRGKGILNQAKRYGSLCALHKPSQNCLLNHFTRIPWGASQSSEYLLKLIQLKYPNFPTRVTTTQTNVGVAFNFLYSYI